MTSTQLHIPRPNREKILSGAEIIRTDEQGLFTNEYLQKLWLVSAIAHEYRAEIRKPRTRPRKHGSINNLKKHHDRTNLSEFFEDPLQAIKDYKLAGRQRVAQVKEVARYTRDGINYREFEVPVLTLRKDSKFNNFRIIHLSDVHFRRDCHIPTLHMAKVAEHSPSLEADFVMFTGDAAKNHEHDISEYNSLTTKIIVENATYGGAFVPGNHDYDAGIDMVKERMLAAGLRYLDNKLLTLGEGDDLLQILGLDDLYQEVIRDPNFFKTPTIKSDFGINPDYPLIIGAHSIDSLSAEDLPIADLVLSGHLHGLIYKIIGNKDFLKHVSKLEKNNYKTLFYDQNGQYRDFAAFAVLVLSFISYGQTTDHRRGLTFENLDKQKKPLIEAYPSETTILTLKGTL